MNSVPIGQEGEERPKVDAEKVLGIVAQTLWSQKLLNEYRDSLIFGTSNPYIYKESTRWQRFKWRMSAYKDRVRDAWLVLTGRAHIADE